MNHCVAFSAVCSALWAGRPWKPKGSLCLDRGQAWLAGWLGARALAKPRHVTAALIPPIGQPHVLVHSATEATRGRLAGQLSAWPARQLAQIIPWVSISESLGPPWRTRGLPKPKGSLCFDQGQAGLAQNQGTSQQCPLHEEDSRTCWCIHA